jgi:Ca-activated chloride channel family protein
MTVLYDGIVQAARELSTRPERRKAILVLSDGEDTKSEATQAKALNAALAVDASIYSVDMTQDGTGTSRDAHLGAILRELSEKTGGIYVGSGGGPAMRDACKKIVEELSEQYTIGYQPSNQAQDGRWRSISVQSKRPGVKIRARKGYRAAKAG